MRLSADDIRDRLKTLKSRGGNRHMRAVSANGVLENEQINDIDMDDPRTIVRSETVSPTSHQQKKLLGDDRPIRPMRQNSYAEAGRHHDQRFKSSSAPATTNSQMAENDWVEENAYSYHQKNQRVRREKRVSAATLRRRAYVKEQEERRRSVAKELDEEEKAKKGGGVGSRRIGRSPRYAGNMQKRGVPAGGNRYGQRGRGDKKISPRAQPKKVESVQSNKEHDPSKRVAEYLTSAQCKPLKNPPVELRRSMRDLSSPQWDKVFDALNVVRSLALHHHGSIGPVLHSLVLSVNECSKNLRSSVAKNALLCLNDMIDGLGPQMDPELDTIVSQLLKRASESGTGFLGDEANRCLRSMCMSCSESKALSALLNCADNKKPQLRARAASHIEYCISQMGSRICGARDLDRVINRAVKFMGEGQQNTRHSGRKIMYSLHKVGAVTERQLRRLLQEREFRQIMELIERGGQIDDHSLRIQSRASSRAARSRQSRSRAQSNASSDDGNGRRVGRRSSSSTDENTGGRARGYNPNNVIGEIKSMNKQEAPEIELLLPNLLKHMSSSDWRRRQEAVVSTTDLLCKHVSTLQPNSERLMAAFDHIMPRLGDNNSKVCLTTLRAMTELLPATRAQVVEVVPSLLPAVAANLASASKPIISAANTVLDMLESCVPLPTLFPTQVSLCVHSNPRVQASMLNRVADLIPAMYDLRPRLVQRHAVPAVLRLTNNARGELRMATNRSLHMLYRAMGDDLVQAVRAAHIPSSAKDQALTSLGVL